MAGYREFQTGEVLTAANVNEYLMEQSVMAFADAAARDTALGTAVGGSNALREGMVAYLDSTDEIQVYDGTSWGGVGLPLGTATPTDGQILAFGTATSTWNPVDGGGLVAVKSAIFTGTQTNSTAAGANFAVTDLSITHEVADASNRLIISAFFGAAANDNGVGNAGIAVHDGTSLIAIADAAGSRTRVTAGGNVAGTNRNYIVTMPSVTFVHTPGAGSKTYTVRAININALTRTLYINRAEDDSDAAGQPRAVSSLVIQEVSV